MIAAALIVNWLISRPVFVAALTMSWFSAEKQSVYMSPSANSPSSVLREIHSCSCLLLTTAFPAKNAALSPGIPTPLPVTFSVRLNSPWIPSSHPAGATPPATATQITTVDATLVGIGPVVANSQSYFLNDYLGPPHCQAVWGCFLFAA